MRVDCSDHVWVSRSLMCAVCRVGPEEVHELRCVAFMGCGVIWIKRGRLSSVEP